MKKNILLLILVVCVQITYGQIKDVNYTLKYNTETSFFDCYLVINNGKTKTLKDRVQLNSLVSIVAPAGSNLYVEESYMPLKSNQDYKSSEPISWEVSNEVVSPAALPDSKIVSISPFLIPSAFYNDMSAGDEVRLFSIKVTPFPACGEGVRLFDNDNDPTSSDVGMHGSNFSNGFTIGAVKQKYSGNNPSILPASPIINSIEVLTQDRISLNIDVESETELTYEFYGPNGLIGDYNALLSLPANKIVAGEYRMIVTNSIGCSSESVFYPRTAESNTTFANATETLNTNTETRSFDGSFASSVYPNPAQDVITLTLNGGVGTDVKVDIVDLQGKVVKNNIVDMKLATETQEVKISTGLNPGMYSVAITIDNNEVVNHKLLIIK
ncbi:MAG: T9SS type A sorting domain-containing protein [Saprospiraceae bacterium]